MDCATVGSIGSDDVDMYASGLCEALDPGSLFEVTLAGVSASVRGGGFFGGVERLETTGAESS